MKQLIGVAFLILAMLCASFLGVFSRQLKLEPECNDIATQFHRALFGTLCLAIIYGLMRGRRAFTPPTQAQAKAIGLYAITIIMSSLFFLMAFRNTSFANAILLHYLTPFIVLVGGALFLKESFKWWYFLLTMAGIAAIAAGSHAELSFAYTPKNLMGNGAAIISAFGFAGVILSTRRTRRMGIPLHTTVIYTWFTVLGLIIPFHLIWGQGAFEPVNIGWGFLLGLVSTALTYIFLNLGMRHISAGRASIINFSEVIFTLALGRIFFKESITAWVIAGCLVLFACITIISLTREQGGNALPPAVD